MVLNQSDPTDHALAAIASILDHPIEKPLARDEARASDISQTARPLSEVAGAEAQGSDVDGYSKSGPGPLDAIRFRWTARKSDDGRYYVDETIGANSRPISSGPMPADAVIAFIDAREQEARERFDLLRNEMTSTKPPSAPAHASGEN